MRICQVLPEFFMGGAETMCVTLAAELKKMGHDVCIVSLRTYESPLSERARSYGIEIHFMDKRLGLDLSCIPRLRKFFRSWKPDVIHTHMHAMKYAFLASCGLRIPMYNTIHCTYRKNSNRNEARIGRFLYARKFVVPVGLSEEVQQNTCDFFHIPKAFCPIVKNGVDLTRCIPKESYSISEAAHVIQVGALAPWKNHEATIQALSILKNREACVHFDFFGEGAMREALEKQIAASQLQDFVTLHGICKNVFPELNKSDIFILPSLTEASPISIIEAMGTGLPIIAANVGGIPDMITDGVDGLLIEPNAQALADAIEKLINDDALRKSLGENAKQSVNRFSSVAMAEGYLALYKSTIG